jgi:protoporphyrinogen oxidase
MDNFTDNRQQTETACRAVIAGAGPAGLTAAYELLQQTTIHPTVFESTSATGGISQTVRYKGICS